MYSILPSTLQKDKEKREKHEALIRECHRKRYIRNKANGICVHCGAEPALPNLAFCKKCREKNCQRERDEYQWRIKMNLCVECGRHAPYLGRRRCRECLIKASERVKKCTQKGKENNGSES